MSYLKRFSVTGSVCPSSPVFGQRAAREVSRLAPGFDQVVVAGIGSGVVASRIYQHHPDAILFECEREFANRFHQRHPSARVVTDFIQSLYEHHPELSDKRVLLASFIPTAGAFYSDEIARFFTGLCRNGGYVMQMRYLPHRMSARFFDGMQDRGVMSERLFTVARNLPPVSMFGMRSTLTSMPGGHRATETDKTVAVPAFPRQKEATPAASQPEVEEAAARIALVRS
ncbi:MAG: hypothetical protein Q4D91_09075 [Lautropia sp.]|nr:hypothetical protein [Lautropia sp.]